MLTAPGGDSSGMVLLVYVVIICVFVYFMMIRPQKKEQKRVGAMLSTLEIGDSILTTSGFYGIVIDITDDTVIVEVWQYKTAVFPCRKRQLHRLKRHLRNKRIGKACWEKSFGLRSRSFFSMRPFIIMISYSIHKYYAL